MQSRTKDQRYQIGGSPYSLKILLDLQGLQSQSRERGIGRYARALAHSIIEQAGAHQVYVLLSEDLQDGFDEARSTFSTLLGPGHVHAFGPYGSVAEHNPRFVWRARAAALLRETFIAKLQPDLVHVGSLFEGFVDDAVLSIGRLQTPHATAVTLYDLIPYSNPDEYLTDPGYHAFYLRHLQDLKRADRLLAISESSKREATDRLQIPAERISVIFAGVDAHFNPGPVDEDTQARLRWRIGSANRFLLYVGAADPRKNVGLVIQAIMLLPADLRASLTFVLAGRVSDHERNTILDVARKAGMPESRLVFMGLVEEADLVALYRMCAALVFPSTHEGFGLPPLEAMACGAPALVADATSLPEVVGRQDCLFDPYKPASLAERLAHLFADPDWARDLRAWGPQRAAQFTWAKAGRRALDAFEANVGRRSKQAIVKRRPRMAFVSPLPPDHSGIADYSADLLRELLSYYEITCIHPDGKTSDAWIQANCALHDVTWFEAHAETFDRILYSIGNSTFHHHMFPLLVRYPGSVILHDAFLSDIALYVRYMSVEYEAAFFREVYASHGLAGLKALADKGTGSVASDMTMNGFVFRNAQGVIVHSHFAASLAQKAFGDAVTESIGVVPQIRAVESMAFRQKARAALDLADSQFVMCCFGIVHPRKLNHLVVEALLQSKLGLDAECCLAFVGDIGTKYQDDMQALLDATAHKASIRFVGRVDSGLYNLYLQATDVAVQLRTESRGETSRATLDGMAYGLPVIVSDIGAATELPDDIVLKVPVAVSAADLADLLVRLHDDPIYRNGIGARARAAILKDFHPAVVGRQIRDLIEGFADSSARSEENVLISAISDISSDAPTDSRDVNWLASNVRALLPAARLRQIFVDVSDLAPTNAHTGIQRVVRAVLERLITHPPQGFRIEPTIIENGGPVYAREFVETRLGLPMGGAPTTSVDIGPGDHYLAIDWTPQRFIESERWLNQFRRIGGIVTTVIYDLLPLETPNYFPDWLHELETNWIKAVTRTADHIACISQVSAESVQNFGADTIAARRDPVSIGYFHLGYDLAASQPTQGLPDDAATLLATIRSRPTFLILGTVEPRKGHDQLVEAFHDLWAGGAEVGLVIVGKEGWMVDAVTASIRKSPHFGTKLIWLPKASDEFLDAIMTASVAVIVASRGEGFGLPLIEAAGRDLPVIARDIPVFREVAGDHAFYFKGTAASDLSQAIRQWLALHAKQSAPQSGGMARLTWAEATDQLLAIMFGQRALKRYTPAPTLEPRQAGPR